MAGNGFNFQVPVSSTANVMFVKELDRIVLKDKVTERNFASLGSVRYPSSARAHSPHLLSGARSKTALMTRALELVHEVSACMIHPTKSPEYVQQQICSKGIHVTKRDLFYTDVKLFVKQTESDDVLEEAAAMLGCTRSSLNGMALVSQSRL